MCTSASAFLPIPDHSNSCFISQPFSRPQTSNELLQNIVDVCGEDHSAVSLTQEILVYLAMFIRSDPGLFTEMLRLRIGLIQNVMISELCRAQSCTCKHIYNHVVIRYLQLYMYVIHCSIGVYLHISLSGGRH